MNLFIDKLRQSPDERKLQSNYVDALALLDEIAKMYVPCHIITVL